MNASILSRIGSGGNIKDYLIMMYRRRWLIAVAIHGRDHDRSGPVGS